MTFEIPASEPPEGIELDRARHLRLRWHDETVTTFALDTLRAACPCAECRARREQGLAVPPPRLAGGPPLEARGAELVGNWGILLRWDDGHETGIFSWGLLRRLAADD
ncbi:MAG TPA: DUF971 domain-containing protein [Acidimicrobiia bacterium]|jgi:DUF971 family protein